MFRTECAKSGTMAKVLILEDEPTLLECMGMSVSMLEHSFFGFGKPEEALKHLHDIQPDYIIANYKLNSGNGVEFLNRCPEEACRILMTGYSPSQIEKLNIPYPVLYKPFGMEQLEQLLSKLRH